VVREAIRKLPNNIRHKVKLIAPRLLLPTMPNEMAKALHGVRRIMVIEQNHTGQFYRFLRAWYDLPADVDTVHRAGPSIFRPGEIAAKIIEWCKK